MSILIHIALAGLLLQAGAQDAGKSPAPAAQTSAANATGPSGEAQPAAAPESAAVDPVVQAVRDEVERLRKTAEEAEAAAPDEAGRTRARLQWITDLLLILIRQQEHLYLQNQALLAAVGKPNGTGAAAGAAPGPATAKVAAQPAKRAGPFYSKRDGTGKAHRPGCLFGERIAAGSRVTFRTLEEAARAGHPPCKVCRPDR